MGSIKENFNNQRLAIPFGKYEAGSEDEFPCNETMIGREGARAKLIDFLTNGGTRKAILITGRRGMGKTSFVQYCLNEYLDAGVERYWRSETARTIRSLAWLMIISMAFASIFVIGSRVLQILLFNSIDPENRFLWLPTALLIGFLTYPLFYAGKIYTVILKKFKNKPNTVIGLFILISFITLFLYVSRYIGNGSPVVVLSRLMVSVTGVYFTGELLDLIDPKKLKYKKIAPLALCAIGFIFFGLTFVPQYLLDKTFGLGITIFYTNLLFSAILFSFALFNRSIRLKFNFLLPAVGTLQISNNIDKGRKWFVWTGSLIIGSVYIFINLEYYYLLFNADFNFNISLYITHFIILLSVISFIRFFIFKRKMPRQCRTQCRHTEKPKTCETLDECKTYSEKSKKYPKRYVFPSVLLIFKAFFLH